MEGAVEMLLAAYRAGAFPMARFDRRRGRPGPEREGVIEWYSPLMRGVLPLDGLHVPRTVERLVRSGKFEITADRAFEQVVCECGQPRPEGGEWIDARIVRWYTDLHRAGHAHSVEGWLKVGGERRLVGGIYGVSIGAAFFAESMFCRPVLGGSGASKVCLVRLARHLQSTGYLLLDTQMRTEHTARFGVIEVPRPTYMSHLRRAVSGPDRWVSFGLAREAERL